MNDPTLWGKPASMNASTLHADFDGCSNWRAASSLAGPKAPRSIATHPTESRLVSIASLVATTVAVACAPIAVAFGAGGRFEPGPTGVGYEISDATVIADGEVVTDLPSESLAGIPSPGPCEACGPDVCRPGCSHRCPKWTIQVDALMLWQGAIPSRPLYLDTASQTTVINADDLQTPVTIDPRYAILYHVDECRAVEVNYFSLYGFGGDAVTPVTAAAYEMSDLAGLNFESIDAAAAGSQASIKSLEVNLRRRGWGNIEWLTGFRWVEWDQAIAMADTYTVGGPGVDLIGVGTVNNLYGWQWGADLMLWNRGDRLRINGIAKAGVYYNHQAGQVTAYVTDRAPPTSIGDADDTVAFVGETGVMASYSLTNWLAVRLGYTFFWLGGIATPADQLASTNVDPALTPEAKVSPYGSVFLQGVQTGLEARW